MLPQGLIQNAIGSAIQVELKTGEIIVGALESTDTWMNLIVKAATHYREGERTAKRIERTYIRGNNIKYLSIQPKVLETAKLQQEKEMAYRREQRERQQASRGDHRGGHGGERGRGRGPRRGGRGGRGGS